MMPNFIVIGAAKSGTTALYKYLGQHPEIFMSPYKEPHFFAFEGEKLDFRGPRDKAMMEYMTINDRERYEALYDGVRGEKAVGEASPMYLYVPGTAERIKGYVPETKMVAILRNPVDRAYSNYLHMVRDQREPLHTFEEALEAEEGRIEDRWYVSWHYKQMGFYHEQLRRYLDLFEREQIRIYLYEDFEADAVGVLQDIFRFLNVDDSFVPDVSQRYNESGVHKSGLLRSLHTYLLKPGPLKSLLKPLVPTRLRRRAVSRVVSGIRERNLVKPPFPPEVRARLVEDYREDVLKLQILLGRDLSNWLK